MFRKLITAFVAGSLVACTAISHPEYGYADWSQVPAATCSATRVLNYNASTWTVQAERDQLDMAAGRWSSFSAGVFVGSNGQNTWARVPDAPVEIYIDYGPLLPGEIPLRRWNSTDQYVLDHEKDSGSTEEHPFFVDGWHEKDDSINIVKDRVNTPDLHSLVMHEMGHALPLRWSLCFQPGEDCIHSPDPHAVMGQAFTAQPDFTPSDLEFCRASCFCR